MGFAWMQGLQCVLSLSAEANLGQDALAGEQFGTQADHEAHHGQPAIPGFSEVDEAEAGCVVRHGSCSLTSTNVTNNGVLLPVVNVTLCRLLRFASGRSVHR